MQSRLRPPSIAPSEASYAYKKRRPIVPLMMEEGYDPDGWLGALVGLKLYFVMYSKHQVEQQLANLMQELGTRGRGQGTSAPGEKDLQCFDFVFVFVCLFVCYLFVFVLFLFLFSFVFIF